MKASLGTFPSPKDGMIGRDVHEKRNKKRKVGRRLGHNEAIMVAGSGRGMCYPDSSS